MFTVPAGNAKGRLCFRSTEYRHGQAETTAAHAPSMLTAMDEHEDGNINMDRGQDDNSASSISSMETIVSLPSASVHPTQAIDEVTHDDNSAAPPETDNLLQSLFDQDVDKDIVVSVLKAFELLEEINGSQKNFIDVLKFGRDLYCKNYQTLLKRWPTTWPGCMNILKEAGYKDPATYHVFLDESHPNLWDSMNTPSDVCKYCRKPGTIQYHYLCLKDKVK